MKVLLYGGGAREHALAWKLSCSSKLEKLYLTKPNDGFANLGEIIEAENFQELAEKSSKLGINLLVAGPEDPLVNGIVDEFRKYGIPAIGPDKKWAMLEGSKTFAKDFMVRNDIPTGKYVVLTDKNQLSEVFKNFTFPVVIKADGLAAGKGVVIAENKDIAETTINEFLSGKFGEASKKILIEEFLEGEEVSLISLWDGESLLPFVPARDYKKLNDGNKGPNTGGMGAYCPVELSSEENINIQNYILKLQEALRKENADFSGIIYSGLILTKQGIKVLEYNMRFGDPETQPLLMHLDSDLLELFNMASNKALKNVKLNWREGISFCVVVAANGYPENPVKGGEIDNIELIQDKYGVQVFFAGVKKVDDKLTANGGRVLSVCQSGLEPQSEIYKAVQELSYTDKYYRNDIGKNIIGSAR